MSEIVPLVISAADALAYPIPFLEKASNGLLVTAYTFPAAEIVPGVTAADVVEDVD